MSVSRKWDKENTTQKTVKLNKNTDADILEAIEKSGKGPTTYIHDALRLQAAVDRGEIRCINWFVPADKVERIKED